MPATTKYEKLMAEAQERLDDRDPRGACEHYRRALALRPDSAETHYRLGIACFRLDELEESAEHLRSAARCDPRHAAACTALGALLIRVHEYDEAIEALRRSLQINAAGAEAYFNLGRAYGRSGQPVLAVQAYQECVRLRPQLAEAHKNLAHQLVELDRTTAAQEHYRTALQLQPHCAGAHAGLARVKAIVARKQTAARPGAAARAPEPDETALPPAVSPAQRAEVFGALYELAVHGQDLADRWHRMLSKELEPAFKELSQSFIDPERGRHSQRTLHRKFVEAVARYRSFQAQLDTNGKAVQRQVQRLPVEDDAASG